MARHLYRLARWSFRRRWAVLGFWLIVLIGAGVGAGTLSGATDDNFSMPGLESTQAFDLIKERAPGSSPDGAQARVVFQAPEGERLDSAENKALVQQTLTKLRTPDVATVESPFDSAGAVSKDGRTGYANVTYTVQNAELTDADRDTLESAPEAARAGGLVVEIGGDAVQEQVETGPKEAIGVLVALIVLVITFGSLLMAGMPLLMAIMGVGIGVSGITIATGFLTLGSTTPILALMLGLAVGIDYALFIVSRYRHEVALGRPLEEAAGRAVGTAGSAVVFAGLTVVIALAGLTVVNINFLTQMGLAAAGTVAISVVLALTLLPALLGFVGDKVRGSKFAWLRKRDPENRAEDRPTAGSRYVGLLLKHRVPTVIVGLALAVLVAAPVTALQLALPDDGTAAKGSGPREAYDLVAENFGAGANGPLVVVVDTEGVTDKTGAVDKVTSAIDGIDRDVAAVVPAGPTDPDDAQQVAAYQAQLAKTNLATITVVPVSGPSDPDTQKLVGTIRDAVDGAEAQTGVRVMVTGTTAVAVDVSDSLSAAFPRYLLLIVGLAFILLVLVFRSLLVPLKAVVGFLITILMTLGATVAVFQWGWLGGLIGVEGAPVMSMLPILITGILFGLAMDYELFLVTRMREEYAHGAEARTAVRTGFAHGARVVTAAAVIMFSVFGSFATSTDQIIKSIGFGLAFGILVDAFLVRMTLVPAIMALVGERMWWLPKWLDRLVPDFDVEGEKLAKLLDEAPADRQLEPVGER